MQKQPPNVQDSFLNHARRERLNVIVYLVNGTKLTGRIKNFDRFAIIMENNGVDQMIFKHAIATITSAKTFGNYIQFEGKQADRERKPSSPKDDSAPPDSDLPRVPENNPKPTS